MLFASLLQLSVVLVQLADLVWNVCNRHMGGNGHDIGLINMSGEVMEP